MAIATLLMVPGSGPSDRDNDGYFPSIRAGLLKRGIATASFDKRGVGESAGDWRDSGPAEQAADVAAQLACLRAIPGVEPERLGLFGHSQGAGSFWCCRSDSSIAFVVTNSGPGVTMAAQERYATEAHLIAGGASQEVVTAALEKQDALITLVHEGAEFEMVQALAGDDGPRDSAELELVRRWLDHDPRPALERIVCSLLAIFGENDLLVPVAESARIFRATYAGPPGNLDIVTIPGADHRLQVDNPPVLHPSYLPTLCGWIVERLAHRVPIAPATSESRAREWRRQGTPPASTSRSSLR